MLFSYTHFFFFFFFFSSLGFCFQNEEKKKIDKISSHNSIKKEVEKEADEGDKEEEREEEEMEIEEEIDVEIEVESDIESTCREGDVLTAEGQTESTNLSIYKSSSLFLFFSYLMCPFY